MYPAQGLTALTAVPLVLLPGLDEVLGAKRPHLVLAQGDASERAEGAAAAHQMLDEADAYSDMVLIPNHYRAGHAATRIVAEC